MQLVNEFVVPRGIDEAWAVLTDVERIAPAMPGAQLTGVEDGRYSGTVKVKVGPVTAAYAGTASFRERDEQAHRVVLDATGKESSGRGRAAAVVTAQLTAEGAQTRVLVTTDLTISGPLAQFGRGAIGEVSTRLLNQFVHNLKETVLAEPAPPVPAQLPAPDPQPQSVAVTGDAAQEGAAATPAGTAEPGPPPPPAHAAPAGRASEVNLLRVAAWPILKRVVPLVVVVAVVVLLIVWLA
jgi:uncharacterized protein